jgi:hypothetical protein
MRPTIPLGPWRLAIDLEQSRALNALETAPTRSCACDDCAYWTAYGAATLPPALAEELRRLGVSVTQPSELYRICGKPVADLPVTDRRAASVRAETDTMRITYHAVGRIISGPAVFIEDKRGASECRYVEIHAPGARLSMAVSPLSAIACGPADPDWIPAGFAPVLAIDLAVRVPPLTAP